MADPKRAESRAVAIMDSLRRDILAGRLEPGRRLTFPEMCTNYAVSVGVLREALVRLVDHGIVRAESNLGFSVMDLSDEDLSGLIAVRAVIEPAYVRAAVETGPVQWEGEVLAAHHLLERTPIADDGILSEEWVTAHTEFHLSLVSGAANRRMVEMTRRLREEGDLYRRWHFSGDRIERHRARIAREHRAILKAVLARDATAAETLSRDHIEWASQAWSAAPATA